MPLPSEKRSACGARKKVWGFCFYIFMGKKVEGLKEVHLALDASKVLGGVQSQQPGGVVRD
jgi:formylmethanofuran:tetrahydromethanopterin formyltransferase